MTAFVEYVVIGLSLGSIYALMAIPLSLIWMTTRTVDLAVGGYAVLGGLYAGLGGSGPLWGAAVGAGLGAASGMLFTYLQPRAHDHQSIMLVSVGILFATISWAQWQLGVDPVFVPWFEGTWDLGGLTVRHASAVNLLSVALLLAVIMIAVRGTQLGRWVRACASNPRNASLRGIPVKRIQVGVYSLGGLVSAMAGMLLVSSRGLEYDDALTLSILGLGSLVLLGMRGPATAVLGALALGVVEALSTGYLPSTIVPIVPMAFILAVIASGRAGSRLSEVRA